MEHKCFPSLVTIHTHFFYNCSQDHEIPPGTVKQYIVELQTYFSTEINLNFGFQFKRIKMPFIFIHKTWKSNLVNKTNHWPTKLYGSTVYSERLIVQKQLSYKSKVNMIKCLLIWILQPAYKTYFVLWHVGMKYVFNCRPKYILVYWL